MKIGDIGFKLEILLQFRDGFSKALFKDENV